MYKKFDMSKVPKWLTNDLCWTHQTVNSMIDVVFKETTVKRTINTTSLRKAYLGSQNIREVKHVGIINRMGSEITYTENLGTGYYQNYLELNRDLLQTECLEVTITLKPNNTDLLDSQWDNIYLCDEIYDALIDKLYKTKEIIK